ncbi:MAG: DUF6378 domain-containing protein [Proteobacteria bacterium]|nr:DUF6378 domain-containing protein [Pseudomonadota bacterium]
MEMEENVSILDEAKALTSFDRQKKYGSPKLNLGKIAKMWGAYLDIEISSVDVTMLMIMLKAAREKQLHQRDNLIDIAGYVRCAAMITNEDNE